MLLSSYLNHLATRASTTTAIAVLLGLSLTHGVRAQSRTTEQGEAQILNPNEECTPYTYAPVAASVANFPPIWQPASILPNDQVAMETWAQIAPLIPTNISVKGTITGNFTDFTPTYPPTDPDCWWSYSKCDTPKLLGLPDDIITVPEPDALGYGFDDGPNCSHNAFYDYLASVNQKATMFYIGSNVMDWPLEGQRGIADGHEICVHTWSHRYMTAFESPDAFAELYYTKQAIKFVMGVTPTCWRPPYGDVDDRIRSIANALNLTTIVWSYDSNDWKVGTANITNATVSANYVNLSTSATNGSFSTAGTIMLTHELNNYTMQEAIDYYTLLKTSFKGDLVPIGVAYNKTQPYVETDYSLPNYAEYIAGTTTGISPTTTAIPSMAPLPTTMYTTASGGSVVAASPSSGSSASKSSGIRSVSANLKGIISATLLVAAGLAFCVA
jgi:hypothetical protein